MSLPAGTRIGPYEVTGLLGAGGMGVVYRARDTRLRREVALKVLPPESLGDPAGRARLLAEARAAAGLNHPNICTVHDVGEDAGQVFLAMEHVEGRRLDSLSGRVDADRARRLGVQLAGAIAHAHDRGIVHRDLKGANVMVRTDGQLKVLDFGLASRRPFDLEETTRSRGTIDAAGVVAGTLPYMAPEVLGGLPADARSDVWGLGVVLYELTTGARPFRGSTAFDLTSAILRDPPAPLPPEVPSDLATVILRCLSKDPAERYARAGEARAALEVARGQPEGSRKAERGGRWRLARPTGAVLALVVLLGSLGLLALRRLRPPSGSEVDAIAVLPFENLSRDPAQEYFADGMTDQLITTLAKIGSLRVTSRGSVMRLRGAPRSPGEIARALDVDAIIEGSVLRDGARVRIGVRLLDVRAERHLWAESYERDAHEVLSLQAEIAKAIAEQVRVHLTAQQAAQLAQARRVDPRAYDLVLLGRHYARQRNVEATTKAVDCLRQAVEADPTSALAHAALAEAYRQRDTWAGLGTGRSNELIRQAALRAAELDPKLDEAQLALARLYMDVDWDWAAAERAYARVLELNASQAEAYMGRAFLMQTLGRDADAIASARQAVALEPLAPAVIADLGRVLYRARLYADAAREFERALAIDPDFVPALVRLGDTHAMRGDPDGLRSVVGRLERIEARLPTLALEFLRSRLLAATGRPAEAETMRRAIEQQTLDQPAGEYAFTLACLHAQVDPDRALAWLERGVREHSLFPLQLRDPNLDPLRGRARFKALLSKLKMPA